MTQEPDKKFAFGKNWKSYLNEHNLDGSFDKAKNALVDFLGTNDLNGKTFLDVGCGSGIHSLAAISLGAEVVSVDIDVHSVECCEGLREHHEKKDKWMVKQGSLLDNEFMKSLGDFDIVYCWGVAHHTGDMWSALENLVTPIKKENGRLFIAIYNTVEGRFGSRMWEKIKYVYVSSPRIIQVCMEWIYFILHVLKIIIRFKNPISVMRRYKEKRGMSYKHDLVDWLGGYPYEHAHTEELFNLYYKKHGLILENLKTTNFIGNNQLLFRRP